jgi:DNA end-binding protein Ku
VDRCSLSRMLILQMAQTLIENLTEGFDPSAYADEYRTRVEEAVRAKVEGEEVTTVPEAAEPAAVVDLMEALKASVEASQGSSKGKGGKGKRTKAAS